MPTTYKQDFFTWTQERVAFLRQGRLEMLDLEHWAEEVADMGKSELRRVPTAQHLRHPDNRHLSARSPMVTPQASLASA